MDNTIIGRWEKRWHPLRMEWVVYAAHRNSRPWSFDKKEVTAQAPAYDPKCYLCPGNTRISGLKNPDYTEVYIFDNDHPVVGSQAPDIQPQSRHLHDGLYQKQKAEGIARVVCYDPRHNVTLSEVSVVQVAKVFEAWRSQMAYFQKHDKITNVLIFENKGELVGVSSPHPHCQIYATDYVMPTIATELQAMKMYKNDVGKNIFEAIIKAELHDEMRIIAQNDNAMAFIPFFARFAYEMYIFPKVRHATLATMTDTELYDMAQVFHTVINKYDKNFQMSFPYIMVIHQAPVDGSNYEDYHLHINILPPLRQPGLVKYLAGPETGAGAFMADTMPEDKAAELRAVFL
ncbi:MAG: galactose-1-phosphate uridylyltransferase [Cytophagales bacterium]|nr:galactose-1-phosphate uridylyltransferase [Cytophagales bacterium]